MNMGPGGISVDEKKKVGPCFFSGWITLTSHAAGLLSKKQQHVGSTTRRLTRRYSCHVKYDLCNEILNSDSMHRPL